MMLNISCRVCVRRARNCINATAEECDDDYKRQANYVWAENRVKCVKLTFLPSPLFFHEITNFSILEKAEFRSINGNVYIKSRSMLLLNCISDHMVLLLISPYIILTNFVSFLFPPSIAHQNLSFLWLYLITFDHSIYNKILLLLQWWIF